MAFGRRLRGALLRLVRNRQLSVAAGLLLAAPGAWLLAGDFAWESGVTDGLALLALATGVALLWTGMTGRRGDWIDPPAGR